MSNKIDIPYEIDENLYQRFEQKFNYDLIWKIGAVLMIVMALNVLWNRKLSRLNRRPYFPRNRKLSRLNRRPYLLRDRKPNSLNRHFLRRNREPSKRIKKCLRTSGIGSSAIPANFCFQIHWFLESIRQKVLERRGE